MSEKQAVRLPNFRILTEEIENIMDKPIGKAMFIRELIETGADFNSIFSHTDKWYDRKSEIGLAGILEDVVESYYKTIKMLEEYEATEQATPEVVS